MANKSLTYRLAILVTLILTVWSSANAEYSLDWEAETSVNIGSGEFAPYHIMSNNGGVVTQPMSIMERGKIFRNTDTGKRFDYGFGADMILDWSKSTDYKRYNLQTNSFDNNPQHPSRIWLQQLWAEVKYRSLYLRAGMKENDRSIFNMELGSGDLTESNNARPIPQVRAGFIDFQNIPFTNGWVQIQGEIAYGKNMDSDWIENHFNHYNSFITTGLWYHYKRCYFRTNPDKTFSATIGIQHAAQFGGYYRVYKDGIVIHREDNKVTFQDFVDAMVQWNVGGSGHTGGDQAYVAGNHIGSWDLRMRYRLRNGAEITAYMQSPWEDGSGIGKLNGWDGVWGLEYQASSPGIISGAVVEYLDFTNQSGPIHYAPSDHPGTQITGQATGADDYYNNYMYNSWTNYGMTIGTPFIPGTIYNTNGYMRITDNRIRGFHLGVSGEYGKGLSYRMLLSHRTSWGTPFIPNKEKKHCTSMLLETTYKFPTIKGLLIKGQVAFDAGKLTGDNFGARVTLSYTGNLTFK